jgi:hypothetical protein
MFEKNASRPPTWNSCVTFRRSLALRSVGLFCMIIWRIRSIAACLPALLSGIPDPD